MWSPPLPPPPPRLKKVMSINFHLAIIINTQSKEKVLRINPFTVRVDDGVCEVVLTFTSVDKILWCDYSNEISLKVLSCGVICFKKFYKKKFGIFVEFFLWSYLAVKGLMK